MAYQQEQYDRGMLFLSVVPGEQEGAVAGVLPHLEGMGDEYAANLAQWLGRKGAKVETEILVTDVTQTFHQLGCLAEVSVIG